MTLGVSWSQQLISAIISFAFGIIGGIPALLYYRKSSALEMFLTDLFATICNGLLYLLSIHFGSMGQFTYYTPFCFLAGVMFFVKSKAFVFSLFKRIRARSKTDK